MGAAARSNLLIMCCISGGPGAGMEHRGMPGSASGSPLLLLCLHRDPHPPAWWRQGQHYTWFTPPPTTTTNTSQCRAAVIAGLSPSHLVPRVLKWIILPKAVVLFIYSIYIFVLGWFTNVSCMRLKCFTQMMNVCSFNSWFFFSFLHRQ